ncbi:unnamed protein product [Trichobilharzia regenti]|uniref:SCP domain-containing protein n=1 Tax=Trichobilharzia regenti TaxID=157069 RepID=A0A183W0A0_TRIRE|nr:unnamed protein product [Trichobilharzia regenti]VDQ02036.1 unnamed protein product [Trichobilharzia regenti]
MLLHWLFCLSSLYICLQSVNSQPANAELQKLFQLHNEYRHMVMNCELENQPPAKYLPDLRWDNELAYYAQKLANTCFFEYDDIQLPKYNYTGQSISSHATVEEAVEAWFEENKNYDYNTRACRDSCVHYTQNTTLVGCGVKDCQRPGYGLYIVCNYAEGADWKNERPYETKPLSECDRQRVPARKPPKPTVATTTTTTTPPSRQPSYSKKIPEPDWTQLRATWNQYAAAQRLQGNIAQTCICFD